MVQDVNQKNKGFTIVEVLVALVIFALILIFMLQGFLLAYRINFSNEVKNTAVRVAQDELSNLRNMVIKDIYDNSTNQTLYCPAPCNPDTTNTTCKTVRNVKGVNVVFGKAISINDAESTYLDLNITVCTKIKDWRTGDNITYTIRTILSNTY